MRCSLDDPPSSSDDPSSSSGSVDALPEAPVAESKMPSDAYTILPTITRPWMIQRDGHGILYAIASKTTTKSLLTWTCSKMN